MNYGGKVCIVTGAARGIGRAIAETLLDRGAKVLIADILWKDGEETAKELQSKHGSSNVHFMYVDVASKTNFEAAFLKCLEVFGSHVDVLVNNAGINGEINWESMININLKGTINGTKLAVQYMGKNGHDGVSSKKGGIVINVSSIQGLVSLPIMPAYTAAKHGIVAYTRSAGHQIEYSVTGVRIVCLCPYSVITAMHDYLKHIGLTSAAAEYHDNLPGIKDKDILRCEDVASACLEVMNNGESGSVWYVHQRDQKPWEIKDPMTWDDLFKGQPQ